MPWEAGNARYLMKAVKAKAGGSFGNFNVFFWRGDCLGNFFGKSLGMLLFSFLFFAFFSGSEKYRMFYGKSMNYGQNVYGKYLENYETSMGHLRNFLWEMYGKTCGNMFHHVFVKICYLDIFRKMFMFFPTCQVLLDFMSVASSSAASSSLSSSSSSP